MQDIEKKESQDSTQTPSKVLIVDDQELNLNFLSKLLTQNGLIPQQLNSGVKVFSTVKKDPPDLILLDINMPEINGFDVCRSLQEDASTCDIPVIFLSSFKETDDIIKAFSVGGVDYISKPFKMGEVIARINTHLRLRKTQRSLQEAKTNFESVFNASNTKIIIADMQGKIVNVNPKAAQGYGYSKEELLTMSVQQLIHPDNSYIFDAFTNQIHSKGSAIVNSIDVRKDGSTFFAEVQGSIVEYNGKPHFLGIIKDISDQKQMEQSLIEAKNAAVSANKAKSNFLAVMSHEIRTPMNSIIGMTELTLQSAINEEQAHNLKIIKESAHLLLDIINDILDFSKIEAGKLTLEQIDFDLHHLLDNIIHIFTVPAERKGLFIRMEKTDLLPRYMKGDPVRIKQILANLINNAIKFTDSGEITLRARQNNASHLFFSVTDTGIGVPEDKYESIFNSFTQADLSTTRSHGGSGLGLTICKKLSELMGGQINLTSKPGFGSTFSFTISFTPGDKSKVKERAQKDNWDQLKTDTKALNILLVEDNLVNAKIAEQFLKKMGHNASIANNGKEALDYLSLEYFDLVLMDVEMPQMNGIEATQRIRNGEAGETNINIPIIAMTAHALNEFKLECESSGMNDFVSKPVNFYELGIILKKFNINSRKGQTTDRSVQTEQSERSKIINKEKALTRLGDCEEIFEMICGSFLEDIGEVIDHLRQAIDKKDYEAVRFNAHTLKGLCGNIDAETSIALSKQLEFAAREGEHASDNLKPLFDKLLHELEKVKEAVIGVGPR